MKNLFITFIALLNIIIATKKPANAIDTSTIAQNLSVPWEILWGPDDFIWITEREGLVSRINPETGEKLLLLNITEVNQVNEAGLLGMALHPGFDTTPEVFLVYTYLEGSTLYEKLVKYTYSSDILMNPVLFVDRIPAATNHDGSRLVISKDLKLYMTTGDAADTDLPQNSSSLAGKILRFNLDGTIPANNPNPNSYIWSKGHRNPQGLVFSADGNTLYSSEHGPSTDDELNIIKKSSNYGWPEVHGYCDLPSEMSFCADSNVVEPIMAWTPTLAVAGIDYYRYAKIPEWQNSILLTTLKEDDLRVLKLNDAGDSIISEEIYFNNWFGRLRDICISPSGDVYIATSNRDGRANSGFPMPQDDRIIKISGITSTAVSSIREKKIVSYPNPATSYITIDNIDAEQVLDITLYNHIGQLVKTTTTERTKNIKISVAELPAGIYFLIILQDEQIMQADKIIVE